MKRILILITLGVTFSYTAMAASQQSDPTSFASVEAIYKDCHATPQSAEWGFCRGYISGAVAGFGEGAATAGHSAFYCLPAGITVDQITEMEMKMVSTLPTVLHAPAATVTAVVMQQAFPCPGRR